MIAKLCEVPFAVTGCRRRLSLAGLLIAIPFAVFPASGSAASPNAVASRTDTPSGYPVPRFVAIAAAPTNCRTGPSKRHPVKYTFQRAGVPVRVIAETRDYWLKIEDIDGDACWAHQSVLKGNRRAIALGDVDLKAGASKGATVRVRLQRGVIAEILKDDGPWVLIKAGDARGWAQATAFWGVASNLAARPYGENEAR
jgi:SH3-like domain-containing protein